MITEIGTDLQHARELILNGQIVSIPTETVYGLAADANNEDAVCEIFKAKNRPTSNPLILHFDSLATALPYITNFPSIFEKLHTQFCPGPLTFVVPKSTLVSDLITGGQNTVAIRFPKHPILQQLLKELGRPLAAPSANLYGQLSPTNAMHVHSQLKDRIPYILDGGNCSEGLESTIIGLDENKIVVYRYGSITPEALAEVTGYLPKAKVNADGTVLTSGMVKHHYATQTPLYLGFKPDEESISSVQITIGKHEFIAGPHLILSENNQLEEAARNLYAILHSADALGMNKIYIEPFLNQGLGLAMNDRLARAAAKFS
jgi:L-threonylcarbamoyladenylate synthase